MTKTIVQNTTSFSDWMSDEWSSNGTKSMMVMFAKKKILLIKPMLLMFCLSSFVAVASNCSIVPYADAGGKMGFVDCNGLVVVAARFNECYLDLSKQYYRVIDSSGYGVIDAQGNFVIQPKWLFIDRIPKKSDGYFIVADKYGNKGVLDANEQVSLPFEFERIFYVGSHCFLAQRMGLTYFVNLPAKIKKVLDVKGLRSYWESEFAFNDFHKLLIRTTDEKKLCLDLSGQEVEFGQFELVDLSTKHGDYIVKGPKGIGVLDSNLYELIPPIHQRIEPFDDTYYLVNMRNNFNLLERKSLGFKFGWQKTPLKKLNDTLLLKGNKKSKNVYAVRSIDDQLLTSNYRLIELMRDSSGLYFICRTKDSVFLIHENAILYRTSDDVVVLSDTYFVTESGKLMNLRGEQLFQFDLVFSDVFGMIDDRIVLIDNDSSYVYINLIEKRIISKYNKIIDTHP